VPSGFRATETPWLRGRARLWAMQIGPMWKSRSFWENVAAGLFGTAVWWVGGRLLEPLWVKLSLATGWMEMSEWVHEAGWLAFLVTIAIWYVHANRSRHATAASGHAITPGPISTRPHSSTGGAPALAAAVGPSGIPSTTAAKESEPKASTLPNEVLMVREDAESHQLSLSVHLRSSKPVPHLRLKLNIQDFTPVLQFHRAGEPWEISRTGGESLLHFDHPAHYLLCMFSDHAASLQIVTKHGRGGCPLHPPGTYRLEMVLEGFTESRKHISFISAVGGKAAFTTDPRQPS
jgi:hypothetical protein